MAENRHQGCAQKTESLDEYRKQAPQNISQLQVHKGKRIYTPERHRAVAVGGEVWEVRGNGHKRFVVFGSKNEGRYLYSPQLKEIVGKEYISPENCRRVLKNEGIVVMLNSTALFTKKDAAPPLPSKTQEGVSAAKKR